MNIMNKKPLRAIILGTLLCCTALNTQATLWTGISALPTKFYSLAWTQGIKPCVNSVWTKFLASELYQDIKWGAVGASSGAAVGGMGGFVHNVGREASFFSILMDTGLGSFFGGLCGGITGIFSRRVKKDLADKQVKLGNVVTDLAEANSNLANVNKKNGALQLKLMAANFQAQKLQQDLKGARFVQNLTRLALKKNNAKFAQEKEKLADNFHALDAQQKENQSKIGVEISNLQKIIATRAKANQVAALTAGLYSLSASIKNGAHDYSKVLTQFKCDSVKGNGDI